MEEPRKTIVEEREELMVSLFADGKSYLRTAHFLSPSLASIDEPVPKLFPLCSSSFLDPAFEPGNLKVSFDGWPNQIDEWVSWVENLRPKYQQTWKKAGIFEAIISSTFLIRKYSDLIIGLAEKWSPETNSFIFPWGETTISLEDVMILGGYSALGSPVFCSVETQQLKEIEGKLLETSKEIRSESDQNANFSKWMKRFMGSGSDIEHEAFLSFWLSGFVFRDSAGILIRKHVFPIAVHLAKGVSMALAPAVLARIYSDLSLLKEKIASTNFDLCEALILSSPLQLVQLWAWERFPELQPKPNVLKHGDPRSARWKEVSGLIVEDVWRVFDSAGESFQWRPYATVLTNWQFPKFYKEKEELVSVDPKVDEELFSFVLCLRPSELVGLGCIQQYLPHRVAMQFGMDQDIPCHVARHDETPEIAWKNYLRPMFNAKLYVPSRFFESDVTAKYLSWWTSAIVKGIGQREWKKTLRVSDGRMGDNDAGRPPGFPPKFSKVKTEYFVEEENTKHKASNPRPFMCDMGKSQGLSTSMGDSEASAIMKEIGQKKWEQTLRFSEARKEDNEASVPPGFLRKVIRVATKDFVEEGDHPNMRSFNKHDSFNDQPSMCTVGKAQALQSSMAVSQASAVVESLTPAEKIRHSKGQMGGSARMIMNTDDSDTECQEYNKEKTTSYVEKSNYTSLHMMVSRLEARIARLEKIVEQVKAEREGQ
ncbi:hypothetical protein SLA2020_383420 [Shorea laevis]